MNNRKKHSKKKRRRPKKKTGSWISASMFILGMAVLAGFYLEKNSSINEVRFTGNYFTEESELETAFEAPLGEHPDSVQFVEIIEAVNQLPFVEKSGVRVESRGRMIVNVHERTPIAMMVGGSSRFYIDREGIMMPVLLDKNVDVPLLHGFTVGSAADTLSGTEFDYVQEFLLEAQVNSFSWMTISEVAYNQDEGVIALSHQNGVKLLFGHGNYDEKLRYWEAFYSEVIRREGIDHLASVDLRFKNQIVTRGN